MKGITALLLATSVTAFTPIGLPSRSLLPSMTTTRTSTQHQLSSSSSFTASQDSEGDLLVLGDDGEDYEPDGRTHDDYVKEFTDLLSKKHTTRNVSQKADAIFDNMLQAYMCAEEADPSLWPNTAIYNYVLEAHAMDGDAPHVLERMLDTGNELVARPDLDSYIHTIDAHANRDKPKEALAVMQQCLDRYESTANPDIEPTTELYNKLISAWLKSSADDGPEQAEQVLKDMPVKPNSQSYAKVMRAYGKSRDDLETIQRLMGEMEQAGLEPDTLIYNELISATFKSTKSTKDAESVLYDMMEAFNGGNALMEPNAVSFRNIIYSYRGHAEPAAAYKVMQWVELANNYLLPSQSFVVYNAAMSVISWSRCPDKAALCLQLMDEMKASKEMNDPTLGVYNHVLNACSHSFKPTDPQAIFKIAVLVMEELRSSTVISSPDVTSYGHFLKTCGDLLPLTTKRDKIVAQIFTQACAQGQVGRYVLSAMLEAVQDDAVVEELLGGNPRSGGKVKIPNRWSVNVSDERQLLK